MKKIITFIGIALLLVSVSAGVSDVRIALNEMSEKIFSVKASARKAKKLISAGVVELNSIPATFSDAISEINSYTGNGAFKVLSKDELQSLVEERNSLLDALKEAEKRLSTISFE